MYDDTNPQPATEEILERVLTAVLRKLDLAEACADAGLPLLTNDNDTQVQVANVHTFEQAGMLTFDRGIYLELSDGSAYAITIGVSHRPTTATRVRSHAARLRDTHRHQ